MPPLEFDLFEPAGDTVSERPLIIYLHTGTFAPIIRNGNATGHRNFDYATQAMCNQFAARGYVVANTDYRLGWNPFLPTEPEGAASLMRAAYRGIQDVKALLDILEWIMKMAILMELTLQELLFVVKELEDGLQLV